MREGGSLNVVVATTAFPSRTRPQKGVFLARDVAGLSDHGHSVWCVVARSRFRDGRGETIAGPGVRVLEAPYLSLSSFPGLKNVLGAVAQRNSTRALRTLLGRTELRKADVVYAKFLNTAPALPYAPPNAARVLGIGEGLKSVHNRLAFYGKDELARYLDAADLVEVKNAEVAAWLAARYDCEDKLRIVPSGVDVELFRPGDRRSAREQLGLPQDRFVALFVGSRNENKGGERVLEAVRTSQDGGILPVMIGAGWPDRRADDWWGLGVVRPPVVRLALQSADAFVLPSLSEGMANAVLEALSSGVPAVVSDRSFNSFLHHDVDCLKVDPLSVADIRQSLELLSARPDLRASLAKAGRRVAEGLSQDERIRRLERLFGEAMVRRRGRVR